MKITKRQLRKIIKEQMAKAFAGTLFVERGGYGYVGLSDDVGNEWTLGEAVAQVLASGTTSIFRGKAGEDPDSLFQLQSKDTQGVQGGMSRWDSDVFEIHYNVDIERVIMEFAELKNLEIVDASETTDRW